MDTFFSDKNASNPQRVAIKRLLILHQGALGDFIATFPVIAILRRCFDAVDGLCRDAFGPLAKHLGLIDAYHPVETARFSSLYTDSPDARMVAWLSSFERVLLFSFSEELAQGVRAATNRRVHRIPPWPREAPHMQVTQFLVHHLLGSGLLSAEEKKQFRKPLELASREGLDGVHSNRVLLGPGAGSRSKRWPLDSFLRLAELLFQKSFRPNFLLGPLEADIEMQLTHRFHSPFPVIKSDSLIELSEQLKTVAGYIGNDSAVGHLAAFLGRPTVIVFGPSNSDCWSPFGGTVEIVKAAMDCRPCDPEKRARCDHQDCLQSISPERICDAFVHVHRRCKNSPSRFQEIV